MSQESKVRRNTFSTPPEHVAWSQTDGSHGEYTASGNGTVQNNQITYPWSGGGLTVQYTGAISEDRDTNQVK